MRVSITALSLRRFVWLLAFAVCGLGVSLPQAYAAPGPLTYSPAALDFGGQLLKTSSAVQHVALTNAGTSTMTGIVLKVSGVNSGDFTIAGACGSIAAGNSCSIAVRFRPLALGARSATLVAAGYSLPLSGTGTAPVLNVSATSLSLSAPISIASPASPLTVTNTGTAPLKITSIATTAAQFTRSYDCPIGGSGLAPGASCTVNVVFKTSVPAPLLRTASLRISVIAPAVSQSVTLRGNLVPPTYALSSRAVDFGNQIVSTVSNPTVVTLTNTSPLATLKLSSIVLAGSSVKQFTESNSCGPFPATLQPGSSCSITLTFKPTVAAADSAAIKVTVAAPGTSQLIALSGAGVTASAAISTGSLAFSSPLMIPSAPQAITLTNNGQAALTISGIAGGAGFAETSNCPVGVATPLAVGASCTISVTYTPSTATPTVETSALQITMVPAWVSQAVALSGTVVAPTYTLSSSALNFGSQFIGAPGTPQLVTVTNTSPLAILTITGITVSGGAAAEFTASSTCGSFPVNLSAGAACSIVVSFVPTQAGAASAQLGVNVAAPGTVQAVALTGTASANTVASGDYTLLAWSELGMHCIDGQDYSVFSVLPPFNNLKAQLVQRSEPPVVVTSGVTITYEAMADANGSINTISSTKTNFWEDVYTLFLGQPMPDVGLAGDPVQSLTPSPMHWTAADNAYEANGVPTVPYDDKKVWNPYPMAKLVARNSTTGAVLATTTAVLAVSDEMSCNSCHSSTSGNPYAQPKSGWENHPDPAKDTKYNILKKHDEKWDVSAYLAPLAAKGYNYQSSLYQTSKSGIPILCASCHPSNALPGTGVSGVNQLTIDMHALHGPQMNISAGTTLDNATTPLNSCYLCHPGPQTRCLRGAMNKTACYDCHGNVSQVGAATRTGWLDVPTCQMCHNNSQRYTTTFASPGMWRSTTDTTFATNPNVPIAGKSLYRMSSGHGKLYCSSCHGSPHAEYPTLQANDNVYSSNLQGHTGKLAECIVCHSTVPVTLNGGPHTMHTIGQAWVSGHQQYADGGGRAQCTYCHGSDYRGTPLSAAQAARTLRVDGGTKTFAAGHQMNCYDCHNGPNGD